MEQNTRKKIRIFFIILHITVVFLYLLVCLVPFLDPGTFWFIALLGIIFPFLFIAVFICLIILIFLKSRWLFLSLAALLISWQQLSVVFACSTKKEFNTAKSKAALRVLSWNVSSLAENLRTIGKPDDNPLRSLIIDAVQMQDADVLCFQEFFESFAPELYPQNIPSFKKMGFNYYYFSPDSKVANGAVQTGLIIFSRYPITDTGFYKPEYATNTEGCSFADIQFQGKKIRIFNTHLESPRLARQEYNPFGEVKESRSAIGKIKRTYSLRKQQAEMIKNHIHNSPYPVILCGDFNDVPNSYSYFTVRGDLQDVFLKKGSGIGRTFRFISPTLRIDFIMVDKRFTVVQFDKLNFDYSDHYAQVTDLEYKN